MYDRFSKLELSELHNGKTIVQCIEFFNKFNVTFL